MSFTDTWQPGLYADAVDASEDLIERFLRIPIKKAINPLEDVGFIMIVSRMARSLSTISKDLDADVVKMAMAHLDVDWANLTKEQRAAAIQAANQGIDTYYAKKGAVLLPKITATLKASGAAIVGDVKKQTTKKWGLGIEGSFTVKDQRVIDHAAASQAHYIRDQWGTRRVGLSNVARDVVARGLDRGAVRSEIVSDLRKSMAAANVQRSNGYWKLIAGVFANRARVYGSLSSYHEAGITAYQFESVLDEVTSQVCRFMHGRKFDVATSLGHYEEVAASEDPEAVKQITPWVNVAQTKDKPDTLYIKQGATRTVIGTVKESAVGTADETGKFSTTHDDKALQALGVSMPPLHGHCRSTVIPIFGPSRGVSPGLPPAKPPQQRLGLKPQPKPRDIPLGGEPEVALPKPQEEFFGLQPSTFRSPMFTHGPEPAPQPAQVIIPPDYDKIAAGALEAIGVGTPYAGLPVPHDNPHMAAKALDDMFFQPTKVPGVSGDPKPPEYPKPTPQKIAAVKKTPPVTFDAKMLGKVFIPTGQATVDPHKVAAIIEKWQADPTKPLGPILVYGAYDDGKGNPALHALVNPKDAELLAAAKILHAQGAPMPVQFHVLNLEEYKKQQAKKPVKKPPGVSPAGQTAAMAIEPPKAPAHLDANTVLHEKVGQQAGSNEGGFYVGKDGIKRYVKFYPDPSQAHVEALSNGVYRALGIGAAESTTVQRPGGVIHAAVVIEGGQTLQTVGLTKERAHAVLDGLAADMLLGNWDVVGQSFDNVVFVDGKVYRIDTGGSLLFRAQGGRKSDTHLGSITEWDNFFNGTNPRFRELADAAGITGPEDMIAKLRDQMAKIKALREKAGGWDQLVSTMAPGFSGPDRDKVVATLQKREELLHAKIAEAGKPKPKPPPGQARFYKPLEGGAKPKPGLHARDLPQIPLPSHVGLSPFGALPLRGESHVQKPGGEDIAAYKKRIAEEAKKLSEAQRHAVGRFSASTFSSIRAAETHSERDTARGFVPDAAAMRLSDQITSAFTVIPAEPGTVFRGICGVPHSVIDDAMSGKLVRLGKGNRGATTSTSWETSTAFHGFGSAYDPSSEDEYNIMYVIHGKTQIPIETVSESESGHGSEHELLVSRDAVFRTRSVARMAGKERVIIIELEEVLPEELSEAERKELKKGLS